MRPSCLVVDDSVMVRRSLRHRLESTDRFRPMEEAEDGLHALDLLRRERHDMALVDLHMPRMGGLELIRVATQEGLPTRMVVVTSSDDPQTVARAMALGASGFVIKHSPFRVVLLAMDHAAAGRRFTDPALIVDLAAHARAIAGEVDLELLTLLSEHRGVAEAARELALDDTHARRRVTSIVESIADASGLPVAEGLRVSLLV